jgi:hypothetical protein
MKKLDKNIDSKAAIFALGGVDIGNAAAWLDVTGITRTKITGIHRPNEKEGRLRVQYAKKVPRIAVATVAMILLSPFLIIVSFFIFASAIRATLINMEKTGFRDCRTNMKKFINKVQNKAEIKYSPGYPAGKMNHETRKDDGVLAVTRIDETLLSFSTSLIDISLSEPSLILPDCRDISRRLNFEKLLVNPVRIDAWQILPAGNVMNHHNWLEMEIQYTDIRLLNKNTVLFLKTFQNVLLTRS